MKTFAPSRLQVNFRNVFRFDSSKEDVYNLNQNNRTFAQVVENNRFISLFVGFILLKTFNKFNLSSSDDLTTTNKTNTKINQSSKISIKSID